MSLRRKLQLFCVVCAMLPSTLSAANGYEVTIERAVETKMRDGIVLRADIYSPKADGQFPVLLSRTPYDKRGGQHFGETAAGRGYVVIVQDVRGRYTSDGEWYPFKHESADGYDTIEWAATLPYSNGKVGMFGGSYVGATQMLAAIAHPPHLAGICPVVTASNYHDGWTYQGGAFEQWFDESWTAGLAEDTLNRRIRDNNNAMVSIEKLPLSSFPVQNPFPYAELAPYFFDWLAHPAYDDFWKQWSIEDHHGQITVPVFHMGAWYDIFLGGTLRNFAGLKVRAGNDAARHGQRLLVSVGGHAGDEPKIGELDFGPSSPVDTDEVMLAWYDNILRGVSNDARQVKPVRIFVMGKNLWRDEDDWPLARAKNIRYYLRSAGRAQSLRGDGTLSPLATTVKTESDEYTYDPADPARTRGGQLCCDHAHMPAGPFDQRAIEARSDVLVYTTPALQTDLEVTGPIAVELYVRSSALDTDFTAKLVDFWPNGFAQNLTDGILRMRYRNSQEKTELMEPGKVYKITIDLAATSNVFLAGHQLRLEISSSNFPRFDRNLNTGEEQAHATRMVKAVNTVVHDREHPSALILPIVPQ